MINWYKYAKYLILAIPLTLSGLIIYNMPPPKAGLFFDVILHALLFGLLGLLFTMVGFLATIMPFSYSNIKPLPFFISHFGDTYKKIYHPKIKNFYIVYSSESVYLYRLYPLWGEYITSWNSLDVDKVKDNIDKAIKEYENKLETKKATIISESNKKKDLDDWDGTYSKQMRRDKVLDELLK